MSKEMTWHLRDLDLNSINVSLFISVAEKHLNMCYKLRTCLSGLLSPRL